MPFEFGFWRRYSIIKVNKGVLSRSNLGEIYKNATRCSANRRLFCVFHANSTLWNGEGSMVNCGGVLSRPNLGKIYKNAAKKPTQQVAYETSLILYILPKFYITEQSAFSAAAPQANLHQPQDIP